MTQARSQTTEARKPDKLFKKRIPKPSKKEPKEVNPPAEPKDTLQKQEAGGRTAKKYTRIIQWVSNRLPYPTYRSALGTP